MTTDPTPQQVLYLWRLILAEDGLQMSDIKPLRRPADRNALEQAGFLEISGDKRRTPKGSLARYAAATDRAWAWLADHMHMPLPKSQEAAPVLHDILARLGRYLAARDDTALADLLSPTPKETVPHAIPADAARPFPRDPLEAETAMAAACRRAAGGRTDVRVRLADLARELPGWTREQRDATLLRMEQKNLLTLFQLDDPNEIRDADRGAAIDLLGSKRHICYLGG